MEAEIATAHTGATTTELTEPPMTEDWLRYCTMSEHANLWTNMPDIGDTTAWDNGVLEMDEERERRYENGDTSAWLNAMLERDDERERNWVRAYVTDMPDIAWENAMLEMDEERERRSGRAYESEEIVDEQLKKLKNREFDGEGERNEDEEKEVCSVCLDDLYRGTVTALDCRHEFHFDCLKRWIFRGTNICPLCKATAIRH